MTDRECLEQLIRSLKLEEAKNEYLNSDEYAVILLSHSGTDYIIGHGAGIPNYVVILCFHEDGSIVGHSVQSL